MEMLNTINNPILGEGEYRNSYHSTHLQVLQPPGITQTMPKPGSINSYESKPFIEANSITVDYSHLNRECIIPVFSKDNEKTIAHQEFIDVAQESLFNVFENITIEEPEIRVSHQIKGRTPEAINKSVADLLEHEKTIYYERMTFIIRVPSITEDINGNPLALTIGGVRAYNQENLYSKKGFEKFKFFIGFQNKVCCNLCLSTDGFSSEIKVSSYSELREKITQLIMNYNAVKHLNEMKEFADYFITEHQFAQLVGKSRLYNHLPKKLKLHIPELTFNDGQFNTIVKDYYNDDSFCKDEQGNVNLWSLYNLFTQAGKSSYIDSFLERNLNAFEFNKGIQQALNGNSNYHWFLS